MVGQLEFGALREVSVDPCLKRIRFRMVAHGFSYANATMLGERSVGMRRP